jgi:hypothetical protein
MKHLIPVLLLFAAFHVQAQVADTQTASPSPASQASADSGTSRKSGTTSDGMSQSKFLGRDLPFFDPGSETVTWDGRSWNINNNRLFQARFEKYLNAPEETSEEDQAYQKIIQTILDKLAPANVTPRGLDEAFQLLPEASNYSADANLCDGLANAVYTVWMAKRESNRLAAANDALERQLRANEWNATVASERSSMTPPPKSRAAQQQWAKEQQLQRDMRMQPYITRLAEMKALMTANKAKRELTEVQSKLEFQSLIVQYFLQRRYQHVLIGTRFYRSIFNDGDSQLHIKGDAKALFDSSTGLPPTVGVLDSLANEAIHNTMEGIQAFEFLLEKNELESGTKRLAEAFMIGEYLPPLRTLPREKKRQALAFTQKSNQLISALEVKDYSLAEQLVKEIGLIARDFDSSKPLAAIETARTLSSMHLAKAKTAAVSGDSATLEAELKEATAIWPRNPELASVSKLIFSQADVQQKALLDLDQLLGQRNYRQIFDDKVRYIAAAALYPERQERLRQVLEDVQRIEASIIQATEISKRGDYAGAWETVERVFKEFPDDNKLNQLRANLTTQAAEFVRTLRRAEELEAQGQTGSSLAWYLKAQALYPPSEFAQAGISRLVQQILPEYDSQAASASSDL